ncbi:two-component system sensor histidine kinase DesK [Streptosporangium album]|uniref:Two-component system sensor histidine kinase DesK n=1 Tax=Streptosporangium album TaxID=47479 RepID=A0A7W7S2Z2_9ACTN|nr:histidine kinase [Streptosporangium album]MBB4942860.1 two-component system sensor histidine kinase DesK [Streptosporangium album]
MGDWSAVSARRFETYARWSTYSAVSTPIVTLPAGVISAYRLIGTHLVVFFVAVALALVTGNILVSRWSFDVLGGRARRLAVGGVIAWGLALVALVAATLTIPVPAMGVTVAAAIGSVAASFVPVLDVRRTLHLNAAILVLAVPLAAVADIPLLIVGAAVISLILWTCWSSAWMLRVLRELQRAHEDRAALTLANERLRISRDLHDVFGRTLATIAVKSELASELVRRGSDEQAADEITGVRRLAEEAGIEVRRVVRGELRATWDGEVSGARSLLDSAGIRCTVTGDPVPEECAEALAWVVREGVTNVLRHSAATQVTLATTNEDGQVLLTIANDGADPVDSVETDAADGPAAATPNAGTGLRAMSERIRALGGHIATRRDGDWFLLEATIPLPEKDRA